jgi:hypothetical protein
VFQQANLYPVVAGADVVLNAELKTKIDAPVPVVCDEATAE